MPFPDSPRVLYGENPLVEVICQLRFPTILDISAAEPADFQRGVRQQYPLYEKEGGGGFKLPGGMQLPEGMQLPGEMAKVIAQLGPQEANPTHRFTTEDAARGIALAQDFLAVTDKAYQRWERFRESLELARAALEQVYAPAFYSRVGLRYRNVIDRLQLGLDDAPWDALLNQALIGALLSAEELRDRVKRTQTVALISFDDVPGGFVTLRHGLVEPTQEGQVQAYRIDADFYTEEREATQDVIATVDRFNRLSGHLFRWAITPRLEEALRPVALD